MNVTSIVGLILYICISFLYESRDQSYKEDLVIRKELQKKIPKYVLIYLVFTFLGLAIPNQKEMAVIYLLPKIANSDAMKEAEKLPKNVAVLLNSKCQKYINDTLEETAEEQKQETVEQETVKK